MLHLLIPYSKGFEFKSYLLDVRRAGGTFLPPVLRAIRVTLGTMYMEQASDHIPCCIKRYTWVRSRRLCEELGKHIQQSDILCYNVMLIIR